MGGKADYGKVPAYLHQVKAEIDEENKLIDDYVKQQMGIDEEREALLAAQVQPMEEAERLALIDALKSKWDHENARYQRICHQTIFETDGKVRRKENCEAAMTQLENDIEMLEHGPVMVRR